MPGLGLIPARGDWEYRQSDLSSGATFAKGCLVNLDANLLVREYLSTDSQALGIAMSHSTASLPAGKIIVAIPRPGCTAYSDLTTGIAQSALSPGFVSLIYKQGNLTSYASTVMGQASRFSALVTIVGPVQAGTSQVEVAFNILGGVYYSGSSHTFAV